MMAYAYHSEAPIRPLAGLRVLDLSKVIAGPLYNFSTDHRPLLDAFKARKR